MIAMIRLIRNWLWARRARSQQARAAQIRQDFQDRAAIIRWNYEHPDRKI